MGKQLGRGHYAEGFNYIGVFLSWVVLGIYMAVPYNTTYYIILYNFYTSEIVHNKCDKQFVQFYNAFEVGSRESITDLIHEG